MKLDNFVITGCYSMNWDELIIIVHNFMKFI